MYRGLNMFLRVLILLLVCNTAIGAQIPTKFIEDNAVTDAKARLRTNQYLRSRNNGGTADLNILKTDASDRVQIGDTAASTPIVWGAQIASDPTSVMAGVYYNTTDNAFKYYNGTSWFAFANDKLSNLNTTTSVSQDLNMASGKSLILPNNVALKTKDNTNATVDLIKLDAFNRATISSAGNILVENNLLPSTSNSRTLGVSSVYWSSVFSNAYDITTAARFDASATTPSGASSNVAMRALGGAEVAIFTANDAVANATATRTVRVESGNKSNASATAGTGDIILKTGNSAATASGGSGNIVAESGTTVSGSRGKFRVKDGSEGTAGQVFVSTDVNGSGTWSATAATWHKYTVNYNTSGFNPAALTANIELFSLPAKGIIQGVVIKHSTAFAGTGITGYTISVGITGNLNKYASDFDVFQATGAGVGQTTNVMDFESTTSATSIKINATATGANLDQSTAGSVDVWVLWGVLN